MAAIFSPAGFQQQREANGNPTGVPHAGNSVVASLIIGSVNVALPVDAQGKQYNAVYLSTTTACWVQFCTTSGDTATVATAPAFLVNPGAPVFIAIPGLTGNSGGLAQIAGFLAAASAATGSLSILGVY